MNDVAGQGRAALTTQHLSISKIASSHKYSVQLPSAFDSLCVRKIVHTRATKPPNKQDPFFAVRQNSLRIAMWLCSGLVLGWKVMSISSTATRGGGFGAPLMCLRIPDRFRRVHSGRKRIYEATMVLLTRS